MQFGIPGSPKWKSRTAEGGHLSLYDDLGGAAAVTAALFVGHFEDVLKELGVPAEKIGEIMPIFLEARSDVLNR